MSNTRFEVRYFFIIPVLLIIAAAGVSPFFEALTTSFFHDVYGDRTFAGLDNFKYLVSDSGFKYSLNITAVWAVTGTILSIFCGFITALLLSGRKQVSRLIYAALLVPWGIPVYIAVPLWRALIHGNGGISVFTRLFGIQLNLMMDPAAGFVSAMFVNLWMTVPLTAFVLHGALQKIPKSSIEAAVIDGAGRGTIAGCIYLPQMRSSLTVMAVLNFIKAFKEFTLFFLMTDGGPPLLSGITERFVIGATTTIDTFLFDVFSNTDDYGISSAFAVIMAVIVIMLMFIWFISRNKGYSAVKKYRLLVIITAALQVIFSLKAGVIPAVLYLTGLINRRFFYAAAAVHATLIIAGTAGSGFLEGFSPGIFIALFVLLYSRSLFKPAEYLSPLSYTNGRLLNLLHRALSAAALFIIPATALIIVYFLIWMSLSGVSACYIDGLLPPHPGFNSFRSVFVEENIMLYFRNTLIVAGITGLLTPAVCFPAALWLNNRSRGTTIAALTLIQILSIIGGMHSLIPLYASFERLGLVNSFIPLIIISIYHAIPFSMFTITAWLDRLPHSFREQALLDGAKAGSYLLKVILPLSGPVLITSFMTAVNGAWNAFMAPLLFLNDDRMYTISVKLYSFVGSIASGAPEWNVFAAASVVNCLIIALIFSRFKGPAGRTSLSDFTD